ncbi:MAG: iron-containing alcohol dehydrogenase [Oscillospiraceae bacterium]|jgi:alcohol dehydrogenase|nr:iron-containing alcohol dehydrogenase [Oscillospiraceae bacterium]
MSSWHWHLPTQVIFGAGTRLRLPEFLSDRRAVLVRSKSAGEIPGDFAAVFSGVRPNPTTENVRACAALIRDAGAETVVALGGGSVLDCAKAAADGLPLIALPTTAGTGSEVTGISVLSDEAAGTKFPLSSPAFFPLLAIVDPELTYSVPRRVAAESGLDALSHALEALWSVQRGPASDALALRAARLILDHAEAACAGDRSARNAMSEGSLLAGLAFSQAKTAGSHACSFSLTVRYGLSHGAACAFTLAAFARLNGVDPHAKALGFPDAAALAAEIDRLKAALGLPLTLAQAGIPPADLPSLAAECVLPANMKNNPVPMDAAAVLALFRELA